MANIKKNKIAPDVSVIIAMFNTADYIEECLNSILNQTLKNVEVIVVDDCSTDNSVEVVKKMIPTFEAEGMTLNLIKLKKNSGFAAMPRNTALKYAKGKYLYYLDSDDFIEKTTFEDLYKIAEEFDAEVVQCERYFAFLDTDRKGTEEIVTWQRGEYVTKPTLETVDMRERVYKFTQKETLWWGCNKFLRREFIMENKFQFPEIRSFEDMVFIFGCVVCAKNYVRVPFIHYHYRIRETSLSHKVLELPEFMHSVVGVVKSLDNFMRTQKFFIENPNYRYLMINFFMQDRIEVSSEQLVRRYLDNPGGIYYLLRERDFAQKPQENTAITAYLFLLANMYRLFAKEQAEKIEELQSQLDKFLKQEENNN